MKYPMMANYLLFHKIEDGEYIVEDVYSDEKFIASGDILAFAKQLDGKTDPMEIAQQMGFTHSQALHMLHDLDDFQLLRHSRVLEKSRGNWMYSVWFTHSSSALLRFLAFCQHIFVAVFFLPVFLVGIYIFSQRHVQLNDQYYFLGFFAGMLIGMALHEIAHTCAAYGFGGYVFEIGIGVMNFMPSAYTLLYLDNIKSRVKHLAVYAAGIETNFFLAGIFLLLSAYIDNLNLLFFAAAISNIGLGVINLMSLNGTDGVQMLEILLDAEDIMEYAKKILHNPKMRRCVWHKGWYGKFVVILCYLLRIERIAFYALWIGTIVWEIWL